MASDAKPVSGRTLNELLKEHQEPFMLDVYLIENGNSLKGLCFGNVETICWSFHKPEGTPLSLRKTKKSDSATLSRIIRHVMGKFLIPRRNDRDNNSQREFRKDTAGRHRKGKEYDGSSSSVAHTICESFSGSDSDDFCWTNCSAGSSSSDPVDAFNNYDVKEKVVEDDRKQLWTVSASSRPTSKNSTSHNYSELQNLPQNDYEKDHNKLADESLFFLSLWETVRTIEEKHRFGNSELREIFRRGSTSPQFVNAKLMLRQTRQLLFDYVREVAAIQRRKERNTCFSSSQTCIFRHFPCPEQLARFTWENIRSCGKTSIDPTNTNRLLQADFSREGRSEWTRFWQETEIVVHQVETKILAEIIHEIITELLLI